METLLLECFGTERMNSLAPKRSHLSSYIVVVEGPLRAADSLETSSEKPASWKCCTSTSMCADGMSSCLRCDSSDLDISTVLIVQEKPWMASYSTEPDVETNVETATIFKMQSVPLLPSLHKLLSCPPARNACCKRVTPSFQLPLEALIGTLPFMWALLECEVDWFIHLTLWIPEGL